MRVVRALCAAGCAVGLVAVSRASDCSRTSVGLTPMNDLGAGFYLGQFEGGLYPGGVNDPPPAHEAEALLRAEAIQPLDQQGNPDPQGKYVLLSIGMSNTTQEFCSASGFEPCDPWTFMGQAQDHPDVNDEELVIANGAKGGQAAAAWIDPDQPNYNRVRDEVLAPRGLTEAQVQIVWVKQANPQPAQSLPSANADAYILLENLGDIVRACKVRYPNLQMIFFSSRIYAGYASSTLNPEPYAYESGFSVKWLIEAQIDQMETGQIDPRAGDLDYTSVAPWLGWGPYPWADGLTPRSDGLIWQCADFQSDGTHPAQPAEEKVGTMLLEFFLDSPFSEPWFRRKGGGGGVPATLEVLQIPFGTLESGTLDSLRVSDDARLVVRSQFGFSALEANLVEIAVRATTAVNSPQTLAISIESRLSQTGGSARVRLRNWSSGSTQTVHSYAVGNVEAIEVVPDVDADAFVQDGTGRIILSVRDSAVATFSVAGFRAFFDWVEIAVE